MIYKALTLYQPFASLWALGYKQFETRSWGIGYRGPFAIHAGVRPIEKTLDSMFLRIEGITFAEMKFLDAMRDCLGDDFEEDPPYGSIIATGELIGCHKIVLNGGRGLSSSSLGRIENEKLFYEPDEQEVLFGDWSIGRYAWSLTNVKVLPEPIKASGKQGLWDWSAE